jgi:UDPglucose--hexose-1-phosphate uridylyltransferase
MPADDLQCPAGDEAFPTHPSDASTPASADAERSDGGTAEIRTDVLTGRRVIVAARRALRPNAISPDPLLDRANDPFATGFETETPGERLSLRARDTEANQPGWQLRLVPNRYPFLTDRRLTGHASPNSSPFFPWEPATGQHDVVIECPGTVTRLTELTPAEVVYIIQAWQKRVKQLSETTGIRSVSVFRNEGYGAGASLAHCHSQIVGSEILMPGDVERFRRAAEHHRQTGRELTGDLLDAELQDGRRIVHRSGHLTILCPFAPRTAWNVRILPHATLQSSSVAPHQFESMDVDVVTELADQLLTAVRAIEACVGIFSYNLTLTLPPVGGPLPCRWMLDILPRISRNAGWEMLTDVEVVSTVPEFSAAELRQQWIRVSQPANHQPANHSPVNHHVPLDPDGLVWRSAD